MDTSALFECGDTANYVVYPKDTQNKDQATAIYNLLKGLVPDSTKIFSSTTDNGSQHWFWAVPLTSANAEKVKGNPNVRMSSYSSFKSVRTDESRSPQLFKNAHRIVLIQQTANNKPSSVSFLRIRILLPVHKSPGVARHVLGVVAMWCNLLLRHVSSLLTQTFDGNTDYETANSKRTMIGCPTYNAMYVVLVLLIGRSTS